MLIMGSGKHPQYLVELVEDFLLENQVLHRLQVLSSDQCESHTSLLTVYLLVGWLRSSLLQWFPLRSVWPAHQDE